jgi:hypothetical protein
MLIEGVLISIYVDLVWNSGQEKFHEDVMRLAFSWKAAEIALRISSYPIVQTLRKK